MGTSNGYRCHNRRMEGNGGGLVSLEVVAVRGVLQGLRRKLKEDVQRVLGGVSERLRREMGRERRVEVVEPFDGSFSWVYICVE